MKRILVYITFLLAFVSCAKDGQIVRSSSMEDAETSVTFSCQVEPMDSGMSKSTYIASSFDDEKITGITLAVYNNSTGELYCRKHYTSGFDTMELKLREGNVYDLFALVNMGDRTTDLPLDRERLLTEYCYTVPSYSDVNKRGIPMSGRIEHFVAGNGSDATFSLRRLFAKVTLNVTAGFDGGAEGGIKVTSLKVGNGNGILSAFGSSSLNATSNRIETDDYAANNGVNASSIVFYVPENRQGTIGAATSSRGKSPEADSGIAARKDLLTYAEVTVSADSPYYTGTVRYRSFIGEDATRNFDVTGNCKYVWNITITEDGLIYDDWKTDQDIIDGRYLRFLKDRYYVKRGAKVKWAEVLETNLLWDDIEKSYGSPRIYSSLPDAAGYTVSSSAAFGAAMTVTLKPLHNSSTELGTSASFVVVNPVTGIRLIPWNLSVAIGKTADVMAILSPGTATIKDVQWVVVSGGDRISLEDKGLDANGRAVVTVGGLSAGTATIRAEATDGSGIVSEVCTVSVTNPAVELTLSPAESTIYAGTTQAYTAVVTMADGSRRDVTGNCIWRTSNYRTARIDQNGVATGGAEAGTCTITALYSPSGGDQYASDVIEGTAVLTVTDRPVAVSVEYPGDPLFIFYNSDDVLSNRYSLGSLPLRIRYSDGSSSDGTVASFGASIHTEDTEVIRIISGGSSIETVSRGTATVSVRCDGQTASIVLYVSRMRITPSATVYLAVNRSQRYTCYLTPFDSEVEAECEVSWSSEDSRIVTVTPGYGSSTLAWGHTAGSTNINASYDGPYGAVTYKLDLHVNSSSQTSHYLEITPGNATLNVGQTVRLTARYHTVSEGVDDGGVPVEADWNISSGGSCVSVGPDGLVTALAQGTARIRGGYSGSSAYVTITVAVVPDVITHYLEVDQQSLVMELGETRQLTALYHTVRNGIDDGGRAVTLSWESSDNNVAAVNAAGTVTARGSGTATLTGRYSADGESYTVTVSVTVARQISEKYRLLLAPTETTIAEGASLTYTVRRFTDIYIDGILSYIDQTGTVIPNTDVGWSIVEGSACAEVDAAGTALGKALGDAVVRAVYKNDTTVTAAALLHIDVVYNVEPGSGDTGSGEGNY